MAPQRIQLSCLLLLAVVAIAAGVTYDGTSLYDDYHYPAEESAEEVILNAAVPSVAKVTDNQATLVHNGTTYVVFPSIATA